MNGSPFGTARNPPIRRFSLDCRKVRPRRSEEPSFLVRILGPSPASLWVIEQSDQFGPTGQELFTAELVEDAQERLLGEWEPSRNRKRPADLVGRDHLVRVTGQVDRQSQAVVGESGQILGDASRACALPRGGNASGRLTIAWTTIIWIQNTDLESPTVEGIHRRSTISKRAVGRPVRRAEAVSWPTFAALPRGWPKTQ
ncbi:hypothetical protein SAMN05444166_5723 [Singulisphaera sp. GP187]|nr:hypothetical protein SAMN05444166_5723 [Singulisphaera sp. GP187]